MVFGVGLQQAGRRAVAQAGGDDVHGYAGIKQRRAMGGPQVMAHPQRGEAKLSEPRTRVGVRSRASQPDRSGCADRRRKYQTVGRELDQVEATSAPSGTPATSSKALPALGHQQRQQRVVDR